MLKFLAWLMEHMYVAVNVKHVYLAPPPIPITTSNLVNQHKSSVAT